MRIAQRETAIEHYHDQVMHHLAKPQHERILCAMREDRDYSLSELVILTGIEKSTISARVNELRALNRLECAPRRPCSVTNVCIIPSRLPVRGQLRLI